ncbi:hypothetical protein IE81DRAFT_73129 [Ceraceosorus guamensis]|uniref:Uncharacterized protein n=1 Tax=Ceraceosorus guamensis TaxID=1522189 RepID=A0A316W1U8_9BASI|nr:hypothetical protein IE81DRAFT_73129 [Ceraceosorus guamensis]PWN43649.1 hypothetical protein IE81DRAFT_73129 [Ceraceosorus guamensis]
MPLQNHQARISRSLLRCAFAGLSTRSHGQDRIQPQRGFNQAVGGGDRRDVLELVAPGHECEHAALQFKDSFLRAAHDSRLSANP